MLPCISSPLQGGLLRGSGDLAGRGRRGDGGVGGGAVLLTVFEAERVAPGWWGGRGLQRVTPGALGGVSGQLGQRQEVQLGGRLGPFEGVGVKDGFPLFGLLVDGELGAFGQGGALHDFGPGATTGLLWEGHAGLGGVEGEAVRGDRAEGEGSSVVLGSPVAELLVGAGGTEGPGAELGAPAVGQRARVEGAAGEGLVLAEGGPV